MRRTIVLAKKHISLFPEVQAVLLQLFLKVLTL